MARTKVTNVSGETLHFGYLPPHGVTLEPWEEVTYNGDLRTILASRLKARTQAAKSLENDVDNGYLCVEEIGEPACSSSSSSSA